MNDNAFWCVKYYSNIHIDYVERILKMMTYFDILSHCPLFQDITEDKLTHMIKCLNGKTIDIKRGNPIFLEGDTVQYIGVVISGSVQIIREDYYGNRTVMNILQSSELFAEVFPCAGIKEMPVSVMALTDTTVLLLDCNRIFNSCTNSCCFHYTLIKNLLQGMALNNLALTRKIRYMSKKTTREKIMSYLLDQAKQHGCNEFVIPHDRQSLADYLGVERSAMSHEISKLKQAGKIDTRGGWFCVK